MNEIIPMFIIVWCLYSNMENAITDDAAGSSEVRINRMEQMFTALTEVVMQQQRKQPLPLPPPPAQVEPDNNDIINLTQKFMKMKLPTFLEELNR